MHVFLSSMLGIFSSPIWHEVNIFCQSVFSAYLSHNNEIPILGIAITFRTQKYIEALTCKTKPAKILVCMIYYPDENNVPSWANASLGALGYNTNPAKIQLLIRKFFEEATR